MSENRYLVIEGVIGAGKTSLARMLTERLQAQLVLEEVEENPFLRDFYELAKPSGDIAMAWAIAVVLAVGGMLAALRLTGQ